MRNGSLKSFADSKKLKYSSVSIAFCAIVIAIVVGLNSIVSVLASSFDWYLDMTDEQIYTASDTLLDLIDGVDDDIKVDIIFCISRDEAKQSYANLDSGEALAYVHHTAEQISERCDNVNIEYHDPIKEYKYFSENFTKTDSQIKPSESTVIVARRGDDGKYGTHYKIYTASSFYVGDTNDNLYGYSGEKVLASAILSLTYDQTPVVYFTVGHGETIVVQNGSSTYAPVIMELFSLSGFDVRPIDLSENRLVCECGASYGASEIDFDSADFNCERCLKKYETDKIELTDAGIPDYARMVVINRPTEDFGDKELTKIRKYLDSKGSVMCFADFDATLPAFYEFMEAWAGVSVKSGDRVVDSTTSSITSDFSFRGNVAANNAVKTYLNSLSNYAASRPIFKDAATITINPDFMKTEGYNTGAATRFTQPLFTTSKTAELNGNRGEYSLISVTSSLTIKDNEEAYSYLVFCPSGGFVDDDYLRSNAYPNDDVIMALIHSLTAVQTPVSVDYKVFASYKLDITETQAQVSMLTLTFIPPLVAVITGAIVIYKRKRR